MTPGSIETNSFYMEHKCLGCGGGEKEMALAAAATPAPRAAANGKSQALLCQSRVAKCVSYAFCSPRFLQNRQ